MEVGLTLFSILAFISALQIKKDIKEWKDPFHNRENSLMWFCILIVSLIICIILALNYES